MSVSAKVILDSISPEGKRLTTIEATMHRFILSENNTHRQFCLAGDTILEFDLPAGTKGGANRRVYKMSIEDFVDKWHGGARRVTANPKKDFDTSGVDLSASYTAMEASRILGMTSQHAINAQCRKGNIKASKAEDGRTWKIQGSDLLAWRTAVPVHTRFGIRDRLSNMRIRQMNERTKKVVTSTVVDCFASGIKSVYTLETPSCRLSGSLDHLIMTPDGYKRLGDLSTGDKILVRKRSKAPEELKDKMRLLKIDGVWRSKWQKIERQRMLAEGRKCDSCGELNSNMQIHHIIPVHEAPELVFELSNIKLLCEPCHRVIHKSQGWQTPLELVATPEEVVSISYRGEEQTYDLSIAGEFPNFLANGVVVHNSRNSASSRAVPIKKKIEQVLNNPALPVEWGVNKSGMQAETALDAEGAKLAEEIWLAARDGAVGYAELLTKLGVHKQVVNRLLEPFMFHTAIISATYWEGFFQQRCSPLAQPEMRVFAEAVRDAYESSVPTEVGYNQWHTPYILPEEYDHLNQETSLAVSAARCCRVSYENHHGIRDTDDDLRLFKQLITADPGHWSPLEHVATPQVGQNYGNFQGWRQLRHVYDAPVL